MTRPDSGKTVLDPQAAMLPSGKIPEAGNRRSWRAPLIKLAIAVGVLLLCFAEPLSELTSFSLHSEFFSYIPLMPLVTGYLIWIRRGELDAGCQPAWGMAVAAAVAGAAVLGIYGWANYSGWVPEDEDYLAIMMASLLLMLSGAGFATLGTRMMAAIAFPVAVLLFMVPYPKEALNAIEMFFQQTSAFAANGMLHLAGTAVSRHGIDLFLPDVRPFGGRTEGGMTLLVNPECSGIHSSQVLLITSLVAGNLFLRSPWRRLALALFVIPLAIARNGFRIFTIAELCVHISGTMIDSPIHHHGGPIFFALSLIPFFMALIWLRKTELKT